MFHDSDRIIIAIDGYSACGKSTLACDLSNALRYTYIDSGAMYRAVTLYLLENNIPLHDHAMVVEALGHISIAFDSSGEGSTTLNGRNVERNIRSLEVSSHVSPVAAISGVRRFLVDQQRHLGRHGGVVMDGRDIGTVVFPDAELKLFLTADLDVRVERRLKQLKESGIHVERAEVTNSVIERDNIDSTRDDSPLKCADDAIVIDNSNLTRKDQLGIALDLARERIRAKHAHDRQP